MNVQFKDRGYRVEAHLQAEVGGPDHGAAPLPWVKKALVEELGMMRS